MLWVLLFKAIPISVYPISGSPAPIFETDENCTHVLVTLPAHPDYSNQVNDQANDQVNTIVINTLVDFIAFANNTNDQVNDQARKQVIG